MTPDEGRLSSERDVHYFTFVGVTTGESSINHIFPLWMRELGRPDVVLRGVDCRIHDDPEVYRRVVLEIREDPRQLGGLVTTHKMDLYAAAHDLFDELDPYAQQTGEVSCIVHRGGRLVGYAKDPISAGLTMDALLGPGYFGRTGGEVLLLGSGGAAVATMLHLISKPDPADRPGRVIVVDCRWSALEHMQRMVAGRAADMKITYVHTDQPEVNDRLVGTLPEYSVVINATGMGKDIPGSPITDAAVFPRHGVVWEFNYRGALDFLRQARAQQADRDLTIEDGWRYFLHGWTQHIAEVLSISLTPELFQRLAKIAAKVSGRKEDL
ncbi:MAG: shikimate dehydrogenase [Anaerolineae bacterium]